MFVRHPAFEQPSDENVSLWRYMDFTKFISLLETSCLYFCRADRLRLDDPFEGSFPKLEYEYLAKNIGEKNAHNMYKMEICLQHIFISEIFLNMKKNIELLFLIIVLVKKLESR